MRSSPPSPRALPRSLALASALAVGFSVLAASPARAADPIEIQLLGINDFHGRIWSSPSTQLAGRLVAKVNQLRAENPNTVFLSSGDNIGASTFESFIADDNPTIDVLNAGGLQVSAVGNHEFDQGIDTLLNRIPAKYGGNDDDHGLSKTEFPYLGANVYLKGTQTPVLPEYEVIPVDGVRIGFVGAVTEETSSLVSPAGIATLDFGSPLAAIDRVAAQLSDGDPGNGEADVVIALLHDGSNSTDCTAIAQEQTHFGDLVRNASSDVDVIFSAHTHMKYHCMIAGLPVVQAASYATYLAQVELTIDPTSKQVQSVASDVINVNDTGAPAITPDPAIVTIVNKAVAAADQIGARKVGEITADITRAYLPGTTTEDRGSESSLGSLVADMQLWATGKGNPNYGGSPTVIAFMNPGGLRADLKYGADGTVTYKQAAVVQPFANTLVTMTLTGAQIRKVLEEQWQPAGASRPRLALGISKGLSYTYLVDAERYSHVVDITFNGAPLDENASYRVVVNSFLASGGDNFTTLGQGTNKTDSGQVDLQAAVDYFAAHGAVAPPALGRSAVVEPAPQQIVNLKAPKLTGTVAVGQKVKADAGAWSPDGLTFAYQWSLNGKAIKGATASSYKVPGSAKGKKLSVVVTASGNGATPVSATSASVKVKAKLIVNKSKPKVTGKVKVGHVVSANPGKWSEKKVKFSYTWKLNGKKLGYGGKYLRIPASAKGKSLTVTVKASKKGFTSGTATSKATKVAKR